LYIDSSSSSSSSTTETVNNTVRKSNRNIIKTDFFIDSNYSSSASKLTPLKKSKSKSTTLTNKLDETVNIELDEVELKDKEESDDEFLGEDYFPINLDEITNAKKHFVRKYLIKKHFMTKESNFLINCYIIPTKVCYKFSINI
jgi:hypothetical protein